jgi:hypothetical protein
LLLTVDDDIPEALFNELALTVLQQSTLCPLPLAVQPVHWAHEQVVVGLCVATAAFLDCTRLCRLQAVAAPPCTTAIFQGVHAAVAASAWPDNAFTVRCCCGVCCSACLSQALHVYPLPHAVVLADASAPQSSASFEHEGCRVMNPVS